ncbi:MAG: tetratricopeptide repeat protein [Deltaproteobacteria bacterium]|nr:tetratricopeptide repeat protein [Deltaproteobacteria bacterium]
MLDVKRASPAWLLWLVLAGCGGPAYGDAWLRSFNAGRRATSAGRDEEASRYFEQAARDARRPKDRDEARFMQARMFERLGRTDAARQTYARLLAEAPDGLRAARARFSLARLAIANGDESGWLQLEEAVVRHPDDGSARSAILDLVEHLRATSSEAELRARLERVVTKIKPGEGEQLLSYQRALSLHRSGELAAAHAVFLETARRYPLPHGNLTDDAFFRASLVAEQQGDAAQAVADLRELLDAREVAWFGQSYERPKYPLAQMRIAELYRDALKDLRKARDEFRRMSETHTTSILCDDALWQEALASHRLGDADEACAATARLRERYPKTRYLGCLREVCSTAPTSNATPSCPDYLRERLAPGAEQPRTRALKADDG